MVITNNSRISDILHVDIIKQQDGAATGANENNLSPFSISPDDSDDLQNSYEDLRSAFSQATIHTTTPLIHDNNSGAVQQHQKYHQYLQQHQQPEFIIDNDDTTTIEELSLISMLRHFPDLPTFICHKDFPLFSEIWIEFQRNILLARDPIHRPQVQSWLASAALQIHYAMVTLAKSTLPVEDAESQPRCLFSAFRRLKDRIEVMYQVFEIIEKGRVLFGQSPSVAIAPLIDAAIKIKKDVSYFSSKHSQVIPVMTDDTTINLKTPEEVTMTELSNRVMDTYNLMPYNTTRYAPIGESSNVSTGFQPVVDYACASTAAAAAVVAISHQHQVSFKATTAANQNGLFQRHHLTTTTHTNESSTTMTQHDRDPLYSHIHPSMIHYPSSFPVTPSIAIAEHKQLYLSLPTSPNNSNNTCTPPQEEATCTPPNNTVADSPFSNYQQQETSPDNHSSLLSDLSSDYGQQEQDDMNIDIEDDEEEDDDDDDQLMEEDQDDYVISDDDGQDEDWKEEKRSTCFRRRRRPTTATTSHHRRNNNRPHPRIERHYIRRTATSYDVQTTHYLKSIFFDIYSNRDKLTKDQRRQVQKQTGLKPRNITYWFSNHKRRFQNSLLVFKKVVKETKGQVKTYDDFLKYRNERGLPEEVHEDEYRDLVCEINKGE